uniref:Uncharacterized protein n=1 Tax=Bathycoccus sp. RCC716 virus 2 TaxID=2530039 RepID=A0A7S6NZ15_9PHYC|nr:hypothetical protein [Bathycoccus sp. RCC716 virus 2]
MFLSNWLVFKIVLAALGRTDYPVAGDLELKYDNANKVYLSGGSLDYIDDFTLWTTIGGETTSYDSVESLNLDASNEQFLLADDRDTNTQLGYGCAIDGDYIIGGAPQDDEGGSQAGAAYIFKRSAGTWKQTAKLVVSDAASNDQAAEYVNISGDYAIIGVYSKSSSTGAAYIFKRDTGAETWTEQSKLTTSDGSSNHYFGWGVSISSDYAISGARANGGGKAYIFKRSGTSWGDETILTGSDTGGSHNFGSSVAIKGDYAVVGAYNADVSGIATGSGAAYVFKRSGTSWTQQVKLVASDPVQYDAFGLAVDIDGDYIAVGASQVHTSSLADVGAIYIFKKDDGAETWSQQAKLMASDPGADDYLTNWGSLSISGDTVVAGANYHDTDVTSAGAAYVWKRTGTTWTEVKKLIAGNHITNGGRFGISIGVSGNTIVVGAGYEDVDGVEHAGVLHVYDPQLIKNYYINEVGKYSVDATIAGLNYKTNEVDVTSLNIPAKVVGISAGGAQVAALTEDGSVYMWGSGSEGRLGQGSSDTNNKNTPVKVKGVNGVGFLSNIKQISCGGTQVFALANDGTLYAWGSNNEGQLGVGDNTARYYPTVVPYTGEAISKITAIHKHSLLCTVTNGYVYACGENQYGQVGDGSQTNRNTFTQVNGVGGSGNISGITHLSGGNDFSMILNATTGLAYGFGLGSNYQLSTGDTTTTNTAPREVKTGGTTTNLTGIANISCGEDFSYFLIDDGTVYASGEGSAGEQGDGANSDNTSASPCTGLSNIVDILGTQTCGFARKSDGTLYVWGDNTAGQFANGSASTGDTHTPTEITSITGVEEIQAYGRGNHLIARKSDGSVWCWGEGTSGQIGNGVSSAVYVPTQVIPGAGPSLDGKFNLLISPRLSFDGHNKLSIYHGLKSLSSSLFLGSNTYNIGALSSDLTIETPGVYKSLTYDTLSGAAYFDKTTVSAIASGQKDYVLEQKIYGTQNSSSPSQGGFGGYIDMNGDGTRMVTGMGTDPSSGSYCGRAKVFHLENGTWTLKVDIPTTNSGQTRFGETVAMNEDGTRIAVSFYKNDQILIYDYAGGSWPTTPTKTISGENEVGKGGIDMNKAGTVLVVGTGSTDNKAHIYTRASDTGNWSLTKTWSGSDHLGSAVAMNGAGTRVLIGQKGTGDVWEGNYDESSSSWGSLTKVIDTSYSDWPDRIRMDSDGTTAVIVDTTSSEGGIYERQSGSSWTLAHSVSGYSTPYAGGCAISYDGTMVLVGDVSYGANSSSSPGRAYLHKYSGGSWSLTNTIVNPTFVSNSNTEQYWGAGVAIAKNSKSRYAIGMPYDGTAGTSHGSVYVYNNVIPDYISFDTYNKLTLSGITGMTSKIHALPTGAESTTTYDVGTATNIYIEDTGTYTAEMKGSSAFGIDSNVVSGSITQKLIRYGLEGGQQYCNGFFDSDGFVYMVGLGSNGQLGQGDATNHDTPVKVKGVGGSGFLENIVDICLGNEHTVACDSSGNCYAWGNGASGRLGQGDATNHDTPVKVKGVGGSGFLTNIIKVSASMDVSYAVDSSGNCYAWGDGTSGRLGQGDATSHDTPVQVKGVGGTGYLANIIQISSGGNGYHALALTSSGTVYAWGNNNAGGLGDGTNTDRNTPVQVKGVGGTGYLTGITKLAQHGYNYSGCSMVLGSNGRAYTWGGNSFGELGQNNTNNTNTPVIVMGVGGSGYLENVVDVACGGYHMHACDSDGTCYGWGRNHQNSPIGDGTSSQRNTPVKVKGVGGSGYLENIIGVGSSRFGGFAVDNEGNVYGWGDNANGQLGDGTSTIRSSPVQVKGVGGSGFLSLFDKAPPSLTFDGLNKYTFSGADTGSTYKLKYLSNTYDLGTTSNVYINNAGTYSGEIKGATNFALSSNVVSGTIPPYKEIVKLQDFFGEGSSNHLGWTDTEGTGSTAFSKDGTRLAIGAYQLNSSAGRVYIYTLSGGKYSLESTLDGGSGQHMGYGIKFNDDGTKIGLGSANGLSARVYERSSSGSWSLRGGSSFGSGTYWTKGVVLDASGNRALGGAGGDNTMKLFDWNGSAYTETTTFSGSGEFGCGIDMTRDGLTVIGINKNGSGNETVKAWKYASGSWSQLGSDIDVGAVNSWIHMARGTGTRFVVGTQSHDSNTGIVKLYEYSGSSWSKIKEWTGYTSSVQLGYDSHISDDGTIIISGSTHDDTGTSGNNAGMVHIFTESNGIWEEKRFTGDIDSGHLGMGVTMSYDGTFYAAVAPYDDEAFSHAGRVRIYQNKNVLDFDGYNKLTLNGVTPTSTKLTSGENTYDIGTATNIYISESGTYDAEINSANTFALSSNVVGAINTDFPKPEGNVWDFATTSSLTEPFYNSSLTKTGTMTHSGTYYETPASTGSQYLQFTFPALTNNVLVQFEASAGSGRASPFQFSDMFEFYKASNDYWRFLGVGGNFSSILRISGVNPTYNSFHKYSYFFEKTSSTEFTMYYYADGVKQTIYDENASGYTLSNGGIVFPISDINDEPYMRFGTQSQYSSSTNSFSNVYIEMEQLSGRVLTTDLIGAPDWFGFERRDPSLTFDGYKLVVKNITPTSSTLKYESNTYDIGTATNVYIKDVGTYNIEAKNASTFALASNVSSGTIKTVEPVIAVGQKFGHALTYDGKLYGWGENSDGDVGVGTTSDITVPTLCTGIPQGEVVSIWRQALDGGSRWAKTRDGRIWVTGDHDSYALPGSSADFTTFTDVSIHFGDHTQTSNNVVWASSASRSTQVLMENGDVWSFGDDAGSTGGLGQGASPTSDRTPRKVNISNVTKLSHDGDMTIALDSSNVVWMWGRNMIGNQTAGWGPYNVPTNIMGTGTANLTSLLVSGETVTDIESSWTSIFILTSKGTVYCTGVNTSGELGQGNQNAKTSSDGWVKIEYFTTKSITVNKLYVGEASETAFVFADTSDGWYCWGNNDQGQLGLGNQTSKSTPQKWTHVSNIKKFDVGRGSTYAIAEDGKYYAWGNGAQYRRGDNTTGAISYPKYIDKLPNILAPSFDFDGYDKIASPSIFLPETSYSTYVNSIAINSGASGWSSHTYNYLRTETDTPGGAGWDGTAGIGDGATVWVYSRSDAMNNVAYHIAFKPSLDTWYDWSEVGQSGTYPNMSSSADSNGRVGDEIKLTMADGSSAAVMTCPYKGKTYYTDYNVKFTKGTTTYDAGEASIVTVPDPGTYDAQLTQGSTFSLKSETVPATKTSGLYTWAFHHGNFDNAYGDGDILTARDNGRFYADTPAYTGDIGTITPVNPTESVNVSFKLNQYTQGSSSETNHTGIMLTEIDVFDDTNTAMTYGTDYRADLYRAAFADNSGDGGTGKLSDETTPYNDDGSRLNDNTLHGSGGYIGWVNGTYDASATSVDRKYPYAVDDELIRLVPLTGKVIGKVQFAYKGTGTTPGWKVYSGTTLVETTNYAGTDTSTQGNQTTHQIVDAKSSTMYTFEPPSGGLTANVLMVAGGGGGGGRYHAGGGGAGGLVYTADTSLAQGATKTIVVGNGDSGGNAIQTGSSYENGFNGKNTTFTDLTSAVGGGGGGANYTVGNDGGSGGGGGASQTSGTDHAGGSGTANQGNDGGVGIYDGGMQRSGGGGGGAGGAGIAGVSGGVSGEGGIGKFFGTGSSFTNFGDEYGEGGWFAGGGGGGVHNSTGSPQGIPGRGGGGYGQNLDGYMGMGGSLHGMVHTGGGGGGSGNPDSDDHPGYNSNDDGGVKGHGGRGGSGIVLIQTNVAPPNGANTAVVQVGNPRRRSLPPAVDHMGSEVNRYYIIDGASTPTYKLPTHWYVDPPSYNGNGVPHSQGSHSLQKRADGGTSNIWYATSNSYFGDEGTKMTQTVDAVFMPLEAQRYNVIISIGSNWNHDIQLEMAADGTAKLYRRNGANLIASGTIKCFTVGKWHHIALTVDSGGNAIGYVNGHPVVSGTYTSIPAVGSRAGNIQMRSGVSDEDGNSITFRKFLTYEVSMYNFHMSPKQVMQRAAEVGLGPKLEYDGLNTLKILNTEPGSTVRLFTSNVADTSNVFIVADPSDSEYTIPEPGKYYAEIKGTDTFTVTRTLDVSGTFPLYAYPPRDGTQGSITNTTTADDWNTWTVSGAAHGNGQYQARTNRTAANTRDAHAAFSNEITAGTGEFNVTHGGSTHYTGTLDLQLPSAKTIRKYVIWTTDSAFYKHNSTTYTDYDPTLPYNGSERSKRRIKSWTIQGSNNDSDWTTIHTVTNKPPSIYGDVHTISSPGSYQYYRLSWSANNGSTETTCIAELIYYGDA